MPKFEHIRHQPPTALARPRPLVVALSPLKSHVNLSTIIRSAGCCGVTRVIGTGHAKLRERITRDGIDGVSLEVRNSLPPVLIKLREEGFSLIGLEQTTSSITLAKMVFPHRTALVVGSEREGLSQECLDLLDHVVEIPVWGMPFSYNVATATSLAMHEYCRQYPEG